MRIALVATSLCTALTLLGCTGAPVRLENSPVRISELHFDPSTEQGEGAAEYVEILNASAEAIDISGWSMTGVGEFQFPSGSSVPARGAVVICRDEEVCQKLSTSKIPIVGIFEGKLSSKGEVITVEDPQRRIADAVEYSPDLPEVEKAMGTGLSIHRANFSVEKGERAWKAGPISPGEVKLKSRSPAPQS